MGPQISCRTRDEHLGTSQPRAQLLWSSLRRKGWHQAGTKLWYSQILVTITAGDSPIRSQPPVACAMETSCFTFPASPDGGQTCDVPLVLPRNKSKALEMISGQ